MKEKIREALKALPAENINQDGWIVIGKALKQEGFPCETWMEWCRGDGRRDPELCESYWKGFEKDGKYDGSVVIRMARLLGRLPPEEAEEEEKSDRDNDGLPYAVTLSDYKENAPVLSEELIKGVLRKGHKMLLSGSSKAGKSFLLMELCVAIAEGFSWLGFPCRKGRVLYVNLEIDPAAAIHRFLKIYRSLGITADHMDDIVLWNLRGMALPMDQLVWPLIRRLKETNCDAVVIDPIYKVLMGDENRATDMALFCNQFDRICAATGCSVITCHHHSKGAQGGKKAMDRASGSGVFARDPDAQLDVIELELTPEMRSLAKDGATAWRLEGSLREFPAFTPVNFWYEYPLHRPDLIGILATASSDGEEDCKTAHRNKRADTVRSAFDACKKNGTATVEDMANHAKVSQRSMREWLKENGGEFARDKGTVTRRDTAG